MAEVTAELTHNRSPSTVRRALAVSLVLALALTGCVGSDEVLELTVSPTAQPVPTATATAPPQPNPTPIPTAVTQVDPTATAVPTPIPTAKPKPTATPLPDPRVRCRASDYGPIDPHEVIEFTVTHNLGSAMTRIEVHHGDGTVETGPVADAYYEQPGTYYPTAEWRGAGTSGSADCGPINVAASAPPVNFGCSVSNTGPIAVGETVTVSARADTAFNIRFYHGDGNSTAGGPLTTSYASPGTYRVTANWDVADGRSGTGQCGTITVFAPTKVQVICWVEGYGSAGAGQTVNAGARVDPPTMTNETEIVFSSGDGQTKSGLNVGFSYDYAGTYNISIDWQTAHQSGSARCGTVKTAHHLDVWCHATPEVIDLYDTAYGWDTIAYSVGWEPANVVVSGEIHVDGYAIAVSHKQATYDAHGTGTRSADFVWYTDDGRSGSVRCTPDVTVIDSGLGW